MALCCGMVDDSLAFAFSVSTHVLKQMYRTRIFEVFSSVQEQLRLLTTIHMKEG